MENRPGSPADADELAKLNERTTKLEARADSTEGRLLAIEQFLKLVPVPAPGPQLPAPGPVDTRPDPANPLPPGKPEPPAPAPTPVPVPPVEPTHPVPPPGPTEEPVPVPVPVPVPSKPVPSPVPEPTPQPPVPTRPVPTPVPPAPTPKPTPKPPVIDFGKVMDLLGKYGLAVIGTLMVAVTAVWGMTYVYQYIGPEVKLAAGGLVAAALIVFGERKSRDKQLAWWAQAIIGAGYAIAYFVGYAAHNVASLQVITNPVADSVLLLALAFIGGFHAVWRKSEPIALLSVLLAFVTISLSHVTYFSVVASAMLLAGLVIAIARMRWYGVYVVGSVASYATFMLFTQGQVMASSATAMAGLALSAAFLFTYWFAFNAVAFLLKPSSQNQRYAVLAMVIGNAVAFLVPTMYQLGNQFPELRWAFLAIIGTLYLASAALAALRKDHVIGRVMLVLGLQLVTAAVPLKLDGNAVTAVWLLETVTLTLLGIRFAMPTLRVFGLVVAAACGIHMGVLDLQSTATFDLAGYAVPSRTLLGLVAMLASSVCYVLYARCKFTKYVWEVDGIPAKAFYLATIFLGWLLPFLDAPVGVLALVWAGQYVALVLASRLLKDLNLQQASLVFLVSSGVASLVYFPVMSLGAVVAVCALPFVVGLVYRFNLVAGQSNESAILRQVYFVAAAGLMFTHTVLQAANPAAAMLPLLVEAGALVLAGFVLRDNVLRQLGAIGFVVTVAVGGVMNWQNNLLVTGALALVAVAYRLVPTLSYFKEDVLWLSNERAVLRRAYAAGAAVLLGVTFLNPQFIAPQFAPIALTVEAVALVLAGVFTRDRVLRFLGAAGFAATAVYLLSHVALWAWLPNLVAVSGLVAAGLLYRRTTLQEDDDGVKLFGVDLTDEAWFLGQLYTGVASVLLGLTFMHLLNSAGAALALSIEGVVLVALGCKFSDTILRMLGAASFAAGTVCLLGNAALWSWGVNLPVVAMVVAAAALYKLFPPSKDKNSGVPDWFCEAEQRVMNHVYPVLAPVLLGWTFLKLMSPSYAPVALAVEVAVLALAGLRFNNSVYRLTASAGAVVLGLFMASHVGAWNWAGNLPVVASLTAVAVAYRLLTRKGGDAYGYDELGEKEAGIMKEAYGLGAAALLAVTSLQLLTSVGLPIAWAVEAVVLLAIGFRYREVYLKATGLLLFYALTGKFLLYDLRGANEGLRFISWFGAAILTLGGSWAFFKFDGKAKKPDELKDESEKSQERSGD